MGSDGKQPQEMDSDLTGAGWMPYIYAV